MTRRRPLIGASLALMLGLAGCDQLFVRDGSKSLEPAKKKVAAGDYRGAVKLYEAALDGTVGTAEAHYRLGLIYDDRLKSPRDALHHFERYLDLAPKGSFAKEARLFKKEAELKLVTSLGKGTLMSQEEAARLRNDNLLLRKTIVELRGRRDAPLPGDLAKGEQRQRPIPPGSRTHTVEPGETLGSIAAKYYKNKARWKDIQDANFYKLEGTATIKPGQELIIPQR